MKSFEEILKGEQLKNESEENIRQYLSRKRRIRRMNYNKVASILVTLITIFLIILFIEIFVIPVNRIETAEENLIKFSSEGTAEVTAKLINIPSGYDQIPADGYANIDEVTINSAKFKVTHYCGCSTCCGKWSSGSESEAYGCKGDKLTPFYSVAADPDVIQYGTIIHDSDGNEYKVMDTGSAIKGNRIDIFVGDHQEALNLGVKEVEFFW